MRILLISPNTEMLPDPVFPLGLAFLSGALRGTRHEHRLLDLCFEGDFAAALGKAVNEFRPDAVGLSIRNVDNVAYPNFRSYLPFFKQVVSTLRRLTGAPIILGGSGYSVMPHAILDHLQADYGIQGEGERSLPLLLDRMEDDLPIFNIPGLLTLAQTLPAAPPPCPSSLPAHEMPKPVREQLDSGKYLELGGMGNIQTKRGCSFSCVYCTYPLIEGRDVRVRPPSAVVAEMEELSRSGITTFFIVDDIFNFPPHHAKSICQSILERGLAVHWSCYLHPQFVTESLLGTMKAAGCTSVEFGTDSGSDSQLGRLGKSFTRADVRRTSELCHKAGMPFCHSLIFGGPGEDRQTLQETFDLMKEVAPTAVIAMCGIRLFPGTRLAETASPEDLIFSGEGFLEPTFYLARSSRPFLLDALQTHAATNPNWILPGSNVNIDTRLQSKLRRFGLRGPLWEYMQMRRDGNP
jgi:radical SAM superfamily enzyme YgiQ (UPF0313 family)